MQWQSQVPNIFQSTQTLHLQSLKIRQTLLENTGWLRNKIVCQENPNYPFETGQTFHAVNLLHLFLAFEKCRAVIWNIFMQTTIVKIELKNKMSNASLVAVTQAQSKSDKYPRVPLWPAMCICLKWHFSVLASQVPVRQRQRHLLVKNGGRYLKQMLRLKTQIHNKTLTFEVACSSMTAEWDIVMFTK